MMRNPIHILLSGARRNVALLALLVVVAMTAMGQTPDKRHVTPVKPETNQVKPPPKGTDENVIQQYMSGDSTAALEARRDSLRRIYKRYPLLTDLTIGVNLAEPLFMAMGQSYASADVNATLNMWNRFQPVLELGLGWAKNSPDDKYFSYRAKLSPYVKIGANYNFMFKNSPDYQAFIGIRLGYSTFGYDIDDIHYDNSYWDEHLDTSIKGERSHAFWGEAGVGLKVKLFDRVSMGWMLRYHGIFSYGKKEHSSPWFVPGYGPRGSSLGFSLSIGYTLPLHRTSATTTTTTTPQQPAKNP